MPIIVQKYGGTSVDGPDRLKDVAARVVRTRRAGYDVIAVVSAMGGTTDDMIALARRLNPSPPQRELDMLVTAGERVTMALLAMAIDDLGERVISFTGSQSGIITTSSHGNAAIEEVRPHRLRESLDDGRIVIVAGYQGVSRDKEVTTLGRGGTDLTAVALAEAFDADCQLYKDVDGILTADPHVCPDAARLDTIPWPAMIDYAAAGAGVLYTEAARFARDRGVPLWVGCSLRESQGTRITEEPVNAERLFGVSIAPEGSRVAVTLIGGHAALERAVHAVRRDGVGDGEPFGETGRRWILADREAAEGLARALHRVVIDPTRAAPLPPSPA